MTMRGLVGLGAILMLAACGGGGGSGSSGGPAAPGTTPQGGIAPLSGNNAKVIAQGGQNAASEGVRVSSNGTISVSFGGSATSGGTTRTSGGLQTFASSDGRTAVISSPGTSSVSTDGESFSHTRFGVWLTNDAGDVLSVRSEQVSGASSFVIGNPTSVDDMPNRGTARFRGSAVAVALADGVSPRPLTGSLTANADFGAGILDASAVLSGATDGAPFAEVTMNGLGISGNGFAGTARADRGLAGSVEGGFAGPDAVELGGVFELRGGGATLHGAFAATSR